MPTLTTFRIEFDRPGATYTPGEPVTGNVFISLSKEKHFRGLKFSAKGEASVRWNQRRNSRDRRGHNRPNARTFRASETYFSYSYLMLGGEEGESRVQIPEGFHKYPFSFMLPPNIPGSFEHDRRISNSHGHIRYTVKAVIDRPWKFDHACKAAFTVVSWLDLNAHPLNCIGINDETSRSFSCCGCFDLGSLRAEIKVPVTGFVPGQTIDTLVEFQNSSSNVQVTRVSAKLEKSVTLHAQSPYNATKVEKLDIKRADAQGPFTSHGEISLPIAIPPTPPSRLEFSNIIDLDYFLTISIHVSGCHWEIQKRYPIFIGSVPLYVRPTAPPLDDRIPYPSGVLPDYSAINVPPMPMPMPPSTENPPLNPAPYNYGPSTGGPLPLDGQPVSFDYNQSNMPPPSYEECTSYAANIRDHDENDYVHGANTSFAPRYPVFSLPAPHTFGK